MITHKDLAKYWYFWIKPWVKPILTKSCFNNKGGRVCGEN